MIEIKTTALAQVLDEALAHLKAFETAQTKPSTVSAEAQAYDTATQILAELRDLLAKTQTENCAFTDTTIAAVRLERVRHALLGTPVPAPQKSIELF